MKKDIRIGVIGGDARQLSAADRLVEAGYPVFTYGLCDQPELATVCQTYEEAILGIQIMLLPVPLSRDHLQITGCNLALSSLISSLQPGITIYCGLPDENFVHDALKHGCQVVDYTKDEVFMIRNALPTAEGAIAIAMNALTRTLFGCKALVIGYGRIGKILSDLLLHMGAEVTVAARKNTDLAVAGLHGCNRLKIISKEGTDDFFIPPLSERFHVVFNTVPVMLLDEHILCDLPHDIILIDLASAPGGIDYDVAARLGLKTMIALSLPGKVAPITAGEIIGDYLIAQLEEGSVIS